MARLSLPLFVLAVAACAQPFEGQVAERLAGAGLSPPIARCMAERWTDRLSLAQLRRIADLADTLRDQGGRVTPVRFVAAVRGLDDPEIVAVVSNSALICALTA